MRGDSHVKVESCVREVQRVKDNNTEAQIKTNITQIRLNLGEKQSNF